MEKFDIIILGSGPGGYVTAIRASQLGLKTAIVEKESLGGVCLNWGCIPTKALLKSAQVFEYIKHSEEYGISVENFDKNFDNVVARSRNVAKTMSKGVNFLMKKNKIKVFEGFGKLSENKSIIISNQDGSLNTIMGEKIIIATGARSRELPALKQDGKNIIGYREAMTLKNQPKDIVIVGSGAIGIEFAYFYNSMGTKVTIVEFLDRIVPAEDVDISKELEKNLKKNGIEIGISTSGPDQEKTINDLLIKNEKLNLFSYLQTTINIFDQSCISILKEVSEKKINVIAKEIFSNGRLTNSNKEFHQNKIKELKSVASSMDLTLEQLSYLWVYRLPFVKICLTGASTIKQLDENLSCLEKIDTELPSLESFSLSTQDYWETRKKLSWN